jgi:hypothetical protein
MYLGAQRATVDEIKSVSLSLKEVDRGETRGEVPACKISSSIETDLRFYVKPIELDWFDDEQYSPYVIVLGQTFLSQGALTIDLSDRVLESQCLCRSEQPIQMTVPVEIMPL